MKLLSSVLLLVYWSFALGQPQPITPGNRSIEKIIEVDCQEKNPTLAKKELIELASARASEALIKEIIGEGKFSRNRTLIENKVIKNRAHFIPVSKTGELIPFNEGFKLSVTLKINQDDLQAMLLENGLFYESDSTPVLLPIVSFNDKVNSRVWGWWQGRDPKKDDLARSSRLLENSFKSAFQKNNFYVLRPQFFHYVELMSKEVKDSAPDWQKVAADWNAQILVTGDVTFSSNPQRSESYLILLHLKATQLQNGRSIGEVTREYETESGRQEVVINTKFKEMVEIGAQELSLQVLDAWQKGAIGSNLFRMTINGRVPLQLQETMKDTIKNQVREVKNVKERLISMDQLIFEIDSNLSAEAFSVKLPKMDIPNYTLTLSSVAEKEVLYKFSRVEVQK